ncbi:MAG: hypothetical protein JW817_02920 [Clostridiales bacterium]|nr:hypothetical protein [Clostridiales bacterium]
MRRKDSSDPSRKIIPVPEHEQILSEIEKVYCSQFIQSLKSGELSFFLDQARHNPDICMEIRKDYVSMYYKGGCALRIEQHGKGYSFHFDSKYCLNKGSDGRAAFFEGLNRRDAAGYCEAFPVMLQAKWTAGLRVTPRRSGFFSII